MDAHVNMHNIKNYTGISLNFHTDILELTKLYVSKEQFTVLFNALKLDTQRNIQTHHRHKCTEISTHFHRKRQQNV